MSFKALCVHAHFYQPPREDPLTGSIPIEPGASPFPNWNERIHAECYRPNAELRNFRQISFNIGPTLHAWLARHDEQTSALITQQDHENVRAYGVGNAMAQAYNHTILPLATEQDKVCQTAWGIADFEQRFGRKPQGMWLPETAVDRQTLCTMAEQGIQFTILAPWQAAQEGLDVSEPYRVALPGGRSIVVFFYHWLSGGMSFNPGLTINADSFAGRELAGQFIQAKAQSGEPQLVLLASDGELYGHHQPFRERFLERLVDGASAMQGIQPMYPARWLGQFPVRREIDIREFTSWSCHHGVQRWKGACGCNPGSQDWKTHLRGAFDSLAAALDEVYQNALAPYIPDPWGLRNDYIQVMLGQKTAQSLIGEAAGKALPVEVVVRIHLLLEAQRERQRMYTSCGFFFDDLDRIEPKNNLAYAAHVVRLIRLATGLDLTPGVVSDLKAVRSEQTGLQADRVFQRSMRAATRDGRVVAG
jgi:alpha-amylase/alpha-mannosidase (GH57 family)